MSLLGWFLKKPKYDRLSDAYMTQRKWLWGELKKAIEFQQAKKTSVWVVTHFPDQFLAVQDQLGSWQLDYRIIDQAIDPGRLAQLVRDDSLSPRPAVNLSLAEFLETNDRAILDFDSQISVSMIAVERHPLVTKDQQLDRFASSIPCHVRFGYYLALDDPLFQYFFPEKMLSFLHHFGMRDDMLADSMIVTRAVNRAVRKLARQTKADIQADSAAEWLAKWEQANQSDQPDSP